MPKKDEGGQLGGSMNFIDTVSTTAQKPLDNNKTVKSEDTIMVSRNEWDRLVKDIQNLKEGKTEKGLDPLAPQERYVKVSFYEGQPIIQIGKTFVKINERGQETEYIKFNVQGREEPVEMLYRDFIFKLEKKDLKVLKRTQREVREHYKNEWTTRKEVDGYRTVDTGLRVPMVVVSSSDTVLVELPDGKVLELDIDVVN